MRVVFIEEFSSIVFILVDFYLFGNVCVQLSFLEKTSIHPWFSDICALCRSKADGRSVLPLHVQCDARRLHGHRHGSGYLSRPDGGGHRQHLHDHLLRLHDGNILTLKSF